MNSLVAELKIQKERFGIFNNNTRKFITSNLLFSLFSPFYLIFSNTFIFSSTHGNLEMNLIYCIFNFAGIIAGFAFTGYASGKIHIKTLMVSGGWLTFSSIILMFTMPMHSISWLGIIFYGLATGLGIGVYWSARNYLTLVLTDNNNRDFFSGMDFILISLGRIVTPFIIGIYIGRGIKMGWFSPAFAYRSTLLIALILLVSLSIVTIRVKHRSVRLGRFLHTKYSKEWQDVRLLLTTLGFFQGAIYVIPTVFIMKFVGGESFVGTVNAIGYLIAIVMVFLISSRSGIQHRTKIISLGFIILTLGAITFSVCYKNFIVTGTYILIFLMFLAEPILNFPIRATLMDVIKTIKKKEKRKGYAYIIDVEAFTAIGRISSLTIFYLLYVFLPVSAAIIIFILLMAASQYLCIPLSRKINGF
jgi:MFS transporter, YQGE family, putative transporter